MLATEIPNHVQLALGRLLTQYKNKPGIVGVITALVNQIQALENGIFPLDQGRQLKFAVGAQLDQLGTLIGIERNGVDDATYVVLLMGTIAENNSDGTSIALLNIVQTVFEASTVFIKTPNSAGIGAPAQVAFGVGDPQISPSLYSLIQQIIVNSLGAAIRLNYLSSFDGDGCFAMAGPQAWTAPGPPGFTPDALHPWPFGFGDLNNPYVGGGYASLISTQVPLYILLEDGEVLLDESGGKLETEAST